MRILHITPSYPPSTAYGGPTTAAALLCEALAKNGFDVTVYCTRADGRRALQLPAKTIRRGVRLQYFDRLTGDHSHLSPTLLWAVWRTCRRYDAVHIHSWWNLTALPSLLLCMFRGIRPVISVRGMLGNYTLQSRVKRYFQRWIGRRLLMNALLHATSNLEAAQIAAAAPGAEIICAPNLCALPELPPCRPPTSQLHLAFIGRLHPVKELPALFEALAVVSFPWALTIAGDGEAHYVSQLKATAARLGIADRLYWAGWVADPEKYRILTRADLCVLVSQSESFANAALEALIMGTPVLLGENVGLADYVQQTDAGQVCAPTAKAIAAALEAVHWKIRRHAFDRQQIAQQARTDFSPDGILAQYVAMYRRVAPRAH